MKKGISILGCFMLLTLLSCGEQTGLTKKETPSVTARGSVQKDHNIISEKTKSTANKKVSSEMDKDGIDHGIIAGNAGLQTIPTPYTTSAGIARKTVKDNAPTVWNQESYTFLNENDFTNCINDPLSTFSIDVDTASYTNIRRFVNDGSLPPVGAVRTEEMINYFLYDYPEPTGTDPISLSAEVGPSPFHPEYKMVKIGLKAKTIEPSQLPPSNLVFLIDVSGSMNQPNKLPLLKKSIKLLTRQLRKNDRISLVVYAGSDKIVLQPTPGNRKEEIEQAVNQLQSGGSTHASSGIITAYELAHRAFIPGGNNRVILASDGDFNVGTTTRGALQQLIESQRENGVYLTVLGFGMGNYHDDTMEILADKGNGNYGYIDSLLEAKKMLVKEMSGTLFTLAKDVKIQVEFNPAVVGAYRLLGYENRALADEAFLDDTKDSGEIGVGHTVTALYEIILAGHKDIPQVKTLKYQRIAAPGPEKKELLNVSVRYKPEQANKSKQITLAVEDDTRHLANTTDDFRFAAAVAGYAMLLKKSKHLGSFTWEHCLSLAKNAKGTDIEGYRAEFYRMVEMSQLLDQNKL